MAKILTISKTQQQELLEDGMRWWFLPGHKKFNYGPWNKVLGGKQRKYKEIWIPDGMVWCRAFKVNAKTVILLLPMDSEKKHLHPVRQCKMKLCDVFVPEDKQGEITENIMGRATEDLQNKWAKDFPFFVVTENKKEK